MPQNRKDCQNIGKAFFPPFACTKGKFPGHLQFLHWDWHPPYSSSSSSPGATSASHSSLCLWPSTRGEREVQIHDRLTQIYCFSFLGARYVMPFQEPPTHKTGVLHPPHVLLWNIPTLCPVRGISGALESFCPQTCSRLY